MSRIYGTARWVRLRHAKLISQPLCEACIRREVITAAQVVDHKLAINKGGDPFPPLDGLMSMCKQCHDAKTNAVDHPQSTGFRRALKGFDVDGNPIDPAGWDEPDSPLWGSRTTSKTGALAGRGKQPPAPAWESRTYLVSCEPLATESREGEKWD